MDNKNVEMLLKKFYQRDKETSEITYTIPDSNIEVTVTLFEN